ncbi:MAG: GNAT family N-acetyltransferase [Candidatus Binatia bacterium]
MPAEDARRFDGSYREHERLRDGTKVRLRLLTPEDRAPLVEGFDHLSQETRYRRFFTAMPRLPESMIRKLLDVDGEDRLAIVAEAPDGNSEPRGFWGIARYSRLKEAPDLAEAAVAVVDPLQRRGLGKLLLTRLANAARERGITHFQAEVQRANEPMNALMHDLDATARPTYRGTLAVYDVVLPEAGEETGPLFHFLRAAAEGISFALRRFRGRKRSDRERPP